ncbi:MAG: DUF4389 domain-containing protein [SAR92 clade bacterium]|uniref:DUF4389 domain-containing protein n=1 Tax=SAR92 clade bacterium TaxID=2315479 RepID=A0A520MG89_9GAMM|nr:MAG: DUF4389 domain-containing protein [SAR92 clade bacterium]
MTDSKANVKKSSTWIRLAYMVLFGVFLIPLGRFVLGFIIIGQFLVVLVKGRDNDNLRNLGQSLGEWIYRGILFLTFNTEAKPFPFEEWPVMEPSAGYSADSTDQQKESDIVETEVVADDDSNIPTFVASEDADKSDGDESGKDK